MERAAKLRQRCLLDASRFAGCCPVHDPINDRKKEDREMMHPHRPDSTGIYSDRFLSKMILYMTTL